MNTKLIVNTTLLVAFSTGCQSSDHEHSRYTSFWRENTLDVAPVTDKKYIQECGSCHFAYQPGLLPARSWNKMMQNLADHFGDNAELPTETLNYLTAYLTKNAADDSPYRSSQAIIRGLKSHETPLQISATRYFHRQHHEIPNRLVQDNPQVKSLSRCDACHTRASDGSYNEHEVSIAGYGKWED